MAVFAFIMLFFFLSNNHKNGQKGQRTEAENNSMWDDEYSSIFFPYGQ